MGLVCNGHHVRLKTVIHDHHVQSACKYGEGMLWGCMSCVEVGQACKIDGNLGDAQYSKILEDRLLGTTPLYGFDRENFIFQQYYNSKHTSRLAGEWFAKNQVQLMEWSPYSHDALAQESDKFQNSCILWFSV